MQICLAVYLMPPLSTVARRGAQRRRSSGLSMLKQLVELHKIAEEAMKGLIVRLWPGEAMPGSYFGLVRWLVDACPWVEVIKRSACIEGARRALARAKVHWGKLDAEKLITDAPPAGKEYRTPEMYYKTVLKGAR